jgi:hypothetical protein
MKFSATKVMMAAASERHRMAALAKARGPLKKRRIATCGRYRKVKMMVRTRMERMRRGTTRERSGGSSAGLARR